MIARARTRGWRLRERGGTTPISTRTSRTFGRTESRSRSSSLEHDSRGEGRGLGERV